MRAKGPWVHLPFSETRREARRVGDREEVVDSNLLMGVSTWQANSY